MQPEHKQTESAAGMLLGFERSESETSPSLVKIRLPGDLSHRDVYCYVLSMAGRPLILLANDDGIDSPGLVAAAEALLPTADILAVAPKSHQSAAGRALQGPPEAVFEPRTLDAAGAKLKAWCLDASPAITVRHALQCLCAERWPDVMVSGINYGENLGTNVSASGTVGAAIEAAICDIKALAVSFEVPPEFHYSCGNVDWRGAKEVLERVVRQLTVSIWPEDVDIVKVDIPESANKNTPWRACRQSREPGWWGFVPDARYNTPVGETIGKKGPRSGKSGKPYDDLTAFRQRREVAITPLSLDMSSRVNLEEIRGLF